MPAPTGLVRGLGPALAPLARAFTRLPAKIPCKMALVALALDLVPLDLILPRMDLALPPMARDSRQMDLLLALVLSLALVLVLYLPMDLAWAWSLVPMALVLPPMAL